MIREAQRAAPRIYPVVDWDAAKWRQYRWAYARLVEKVDAHIATVLLALEASGHADNTVVVFASDHGDGNGHHHWNQKTVLYDEVATVPLIISGAGVQPHGVVEARLASTTLDLMPTFCEIAKADTPEGLQGRSLWPLAQGEAPQDWREYVAVESEFATSFMEMGEETGQKGRLIRTDRHKYIVYALGEHREQLFDMADDPGETRNLAEDPAHEQTLQRHRALLADWLRRTTDRFPVAGE